MASPLLSTKLYIPPFHQGIISRSKPIDQLNTGRESKLILVSAPAGYGKTTLLAEWTNQLASSICWVSLDSQDNDLLRFFSYLIASLRSIEIQISENILAKLIDQRPETISELFSHLINQVAATSQSTFLVLDDFHQIENREIHQAINYMLENLPQNMHLVLATRSDPPLRIAKLRAQGQLCEIRADDLRFTNEEAIEYFNQNMRLGLTQLDVTALMQKTEGWIVGLQLAGISLQKHPNKHLFVRSFAGNDRHIADYLFDEAFDRQPDHIQSFLLYTSILDRFNASLCNAIVQQNDSQEVLAELDRANLFLVPLDSQRNWYRYHHLFRDLLLNRLRQTMANRILELHTQASIWYEENNLLADSITHAIAANHFDRVVYLTEEMAVHKMYAGELSTLITWLDQQPKEILFRFPWLLVARSWAYINSGKFNSVFSSLTELETILNNQSHSPELKNRILGHIAAIRSYYYELMGNAPDLVILEAKNALQLLTDEDIHLRSFITIRWADGLSWHGDYHKAIQALREAGNASKVIGDGQLAVNAFSEMAIRQMVVGELKQAHKDIIEAKDYAEILAKKEGRRPPSMGVLYRHLSNIKFELNELLEAEFYAQQAIKNSQQQGEKEDLYIAYFVLAKVYYGFGDINKFDQYCDQGMEIIQQIQPNGLITGNNIKNHFYLLQGRTDEPEIWVRERGLTINDHIEYSRRLEYQNFARLLAEQGNFAQALQVIDNLLHVTDNAGAKWHWLRLKIIQAKIFKGQKNQEKAVQALEETLGIARLEGFVRSFLDEGESVAQLLYLTAQNGIYPDYCQKLLDEFSKEIPITFNHLEKYENLVEPLTERELEVLQRIAHGCSNQEIAQELIISLYTVKSHARNIFGKLGVKNRTEAVSKARLYRLLLEE